MERARLQSLTEQPDSAQEGGLVRGGEPMELREEAGNRLVCGHGHNSRTKSERSCEGSACLRPRGCGQLVQECVERGITGTDDRSSRGEVLVRFVDRLLRGGVWRIDPFVRLGVRPSAGLRHFPLRLSGVSPGPSMTASQCPSKHARTCQHLQEPRGVSYGCPSVCGLPRPTTGRVRGCRPAPPGGTRDSTVVVQGSHRRMLVGTGQSCPVGVAGADAG